VVDLNVVPRSTKLLIQEHVLDEITHPQKVNTVPLWCYPNNYVSVPPAAQHSSSNAVLNNSITLGAGQFNQWQTGGVSSKLIYKLSHYFCTIFFCLIMELEQLKLLITQLSFKMSLNSN